MTGGKLLITCPSLSDRTGLEVFVCEISEALAQRKWDVTVYAPTQGQLAQELRTRGVSVISDIRAAKKPDIIHGTFYFETLIACDAFPDTPMVFQTHAALIWMALPPKSPSLRAVMSVDDACTWSIRSTGIDALDIVMTLNFADTEKFAPRSPLPTAPRKALVFSNYAQPGAYPEILKRRCAAFGIEVDIAGSGVGAATTEPQVLLREYDLVFAKGRCAIEAIAVGCAVIPCDVRGMAALVSTSNFDELRRRNFGWSTHTTPHDSEFLDEQIRAYDPADVALVQARMRAEGSMHTAIDQLEDVYRGVLSAGPASPIYSREDLVKDVRARLTRAAAEAGRYAPLGRATLLLDHLLCKGSEPA
jgi:hypothetical protein